MLITEHEFTENLEFMQKPLANSIFHVKTYAFVPVNRVRVIFGQP